MIGKSRLGERKLDVRFTPWGKMKGRGDLILFVHPSPSQRLSEPAATLTLPRRRGRGIDVEISNISG
jgi:hypothetical protein